jgi:hypothetical protein
MLILKIWKSYFYLCQNMGYGILECLEVFVHPLQDVESEPSKETKSTDTNEEITLPLSDKEF